MKLVARLLFLTLLLLVVASGAAYQSGRQSPNDPVAITEQRYGVDLESSMVATNGIRLHVIQAGPQDGPPVVLLHGYPEFWFAWSAQIAQLAKAGFRVIAPDQRGYNASDKPAGVEAYRVELLMQDIIGLTQSLGHEKVYLAAHDWGGAIAWDLVIQHPERFTKLVMFNAAHPLAWADAEAEDEQAKAGQGKPKEKSINWYRTFFQIPYLPEIVGPAGNWYLLAKNLRDTSRPGTFSDADMDLYRYAWDRDGSMHAMVNWYRASFRYPYRVSGDGLVKVPTHIVWGMQDRFFQSRLAGLSLKHCVDASLRELPDATHWLLHEEPDLTSRAMIEFFSTPPN